MHASSDQIELQWSYETSIDLSVDRPFAALRFKPGQYFKRRLVRLHAKAVDVPWRSPASAPLLTSSKCSEHVRFRPEADVHLDIADVQILRREACGTRPWQLFTSSDRGVRFLPLVRAGKSNDDDVPLQ